LAWLFVMVVFQDGAIMEQTTTGKVTAALCKAMGDIGAIEKTGYNAFHKYKYASDTDIKKAVQPAFARHELALRPLELLSLDGTGESKSNRVDMVVRWRLSHSSGEWMDFEVPSTGMDSGDKAIYKAITGNFKYALAQICIIPTDDDAERESPNSKPKRSRKKTPALPPPADPPIERVTLQRSPDWEDHQKAFCAALTDIGFRYEAVCELCENLGRPRPSQMDKTQRLKLMTYLKSNEGKLKMSDLEAP